MVVEEGGGFGFSKLKESGTSSTKGSNVHNMCSGKSVSCLHELFHVTLPVFAMRHRFFPLHS